MVSVSPPPPSGGPVRDPHGSPLSLNESYYVPPVDTDSEDDDEGHLFGIGGLHHLPMDLLKDAEHASEDENILPGPQHDPIPAEINPQHAIHPQPQPVNPHVRRRKDNAFEQYLNDHPDARTRQLFAEQQQDRFFIYNDHLDRVEPNYQYIRHRDGLPYAPPDASRSTNFYKRLVTFAHPTIPTDNQIRKQENKVLPFGKVEGKQSEISAEIQIKLVPKMLYIHIKRGVSPEALDILIKRIIEHSKERGTRILKQHTKKGKFSYNTWISTKKMKEITEQILYDKILKITRNRTRSVTLIVRQKKIDRGTVHNLVDTSFSLL